MKTEFVWILKPLVLCVVCIVSLFAISFYMAGKYLSAVLIINAIFGGITVAFLIGILWNHVTNPNKNT